MRERLAKGMRQHIREDLKPEARNAQTEEEAWNVTQEILEERVETYPERFSTSFAAIREYHLRRWSYRGKSLAFKEVAEMIKGFDSKYNEEVLDHAREVFAVITQIYSKP